MRAISSDGSNRAYYVFFTDAAGVTVSCVVPDKIYGYARSDFLSVIESVRVFFREVDEDHKSKNLFRSYSAGGHDPTECRAPIAKDGGDITIASS